MQAQNTDPTPNVFQYYGRKAEKQINRAVKFVGRKWRQLPLYVEVPLLALCAFIFFKLIITNTIFSRSQLTLLSLSIVMGQGMQTFLFQSQQRFMAERPCCTIALTA
jgi:hypothetical protein